MTEIKICSKCQIEKELIKSNFQWREKSQRWSNICKKCLSDSDKIYYANNIDKRKQYCKDNEEKIANYQIQYYINNKEHLAEYKLQYKEGHKQEIAEYQKDYRENHKNEIAGYKSKYYDDNKEEIEKYQSQYREDHKEEISEYQKDYRKNNREEINKQSREKRQNDVLVKIRRYTSNTINNMLKSQGGSKQGHSILQYLEWKPQELKDHLIKLFTDPAADYNQDNNGNFWMNENNRGRYNSKTWDDNDSTWTWQLDHIIPQSDLPYDTMEHPNFRKAWDLSNLRPYSAKQNHADGVNRTRHKKDQ